MFRLAWLSVASLAVATPVAAETFFVAPSPAGDDGAAGSEAAPFATLQRAAERVGAGDEVRVAEGRYAGFALRTSGRSDAPIAFVAAPGVVIDRPSDEQETGIHLENTSYVTIQGFSIEGVAGRGLAHRGATATEPARGLHIVDNRVDNVGREGMYLSQVADSLIEGNTILHAGNGSTDLTHGIYLANGGSDGTTLRHNHIAFSGTAGIHFNGDLSIGGDGVISDLVVEGNLIHDNGQNGLNMDGVQDSVVQNNLIYGNTLNGLRAYAIDGAEGPGGLHIVNNTFLVPAGAGWCVRVTDAVGEIVVFNNVLMNGSDSNGSIGVDGLAFLQSDHNAVVDAFTPDRDDSYLDLAEWQALGQDEHSFVTTPEALFVSPDSDLGLRPEAPVIDRGVASFSGVQAPATDRRRATRPTGMAIDIGAEERCTDGPCPIGPVDPMTTGTDSDPDPDTTAQPPDTTADGPGSGEAPDDAEPSGPDAGLANGMEDGMEDSAGGGSEGSGMDSTDGGCGCHMVGAGARSTNSMLSVTALAIVLGVRRRRVRR